MRELVDQRRCCLLHIALQQRFGGRRKSLFFDSGHHVTSPSPRRIFGDRERRMPHAQPRMSSFTRIHLSSTPILREKHGEVARSGLKVFGIHRTQHLVLCDSGIERRDERLERRHSTDDIEDLMRMHLGLRVVTGGFGRGVIWLGHRARS